MDEKTKEDEIMEFVKSLKDDMDKLKKDNALLLQIADKKRLATYYERHHEKIPSIVKLRMMDDKVILGWRTLKDDVFLNATTGKIVENQTIQVIYEDGKSEEFRYVDYVRRYTQTKCKVLSTIKDEKSDKTKLKVEREDDGKKYEIGIEYIN